MGDDAGREEEPSNFCRVLLKFRNHFCWILELPKTKKRTNKSIPEETKQLLWLVNLVAMRLFNRNLRLQDVTLMYFTALATLMVILVASYQAPGGGGEPVEVFPLQPGAPSSRPRPLLPMPFRVPLDPRGDVQLAWNVSYAQQEIYMELRVKDIQQGLVLGMSDRGQLTDADLVVLWSTGTKSYFGVSVGTFCTFRSLCTILEVIIKNSIHFLRRYLLPRSCLSLEIDSEGKKKGFWKYPRGDVSRYLDITIMSHHSWNITIFLLNCTTQAINKPDSLWHFRSSSMICRVFTNRFFHLQFSLFRLTNPTDNVSFPRPQHSLPLLCQPGLIGFISLFFS